jgi:peptide/nickel transport system ATP-binding protein
VLRAPEHPYTRRLLSAARLDLVEPGQMIALEDA